MGPDGGESVDPLIRPLIGRGTALALVGGTVGLVAVYFATRRLDPADPSVAGIRTVFDFDNEGTVPTWWNASLLAAVAAVLLGAAGLATEALPPSRRSLVIAGLIAGFLAMDEASQLHQLANTPVAEVLAARGISLDIFFWVIPGTVAAIVLGLAALRWWRTLPRRIGNGLLGAMGLYFVGAIGIETAASQRYFGGGGDRYIYLMLAEELCEMGGVILALVAVGGFLGVDRTDGVPVLRRMPPEASG